MNEIRNGQASGVLTVEEVAQELRCSKAHVCNMINGKVKNVSPLPVIQMGRRKLIRRNSLEGWMKSMESQRPGAVVSSLHCQDPMPQTHGEEKNHA